MLWLLNLFYVLYEMNYILCILTYKCKLFIRVTKNWRKYKKFLKHFQQEWTRRFWQLESDRMTAKLEGMTLSEEREFMEMMEIGDKEEKHGDQDGANVKIESGRRH